MYRELYSQYLYLQKHQEKHLLANHYFEDLKALIIASYLFKDDKKDYFTKDGGCSIVYLSMPAGKKDDYASCQFVAGIVEDVLQKDKDLGENVSFIPDRDRHGKVD